VEHINYTIAILAPGASVTYTFTPPLTRWQKVSMVTRRRRRFRMTQRRPTNLDRHDFPGVAITTASPAITLGTTATTLTIRPIWK